MEDPPKHNNSSNKKNNRKTINIGAGAGSFGIGGIVLFGGAIVTATLVSAAFAFKNRRQKQSSSSSTSTRDEVTSMKEMESKTIHDSSQDEKHNSGTDNDEKVGTGDSNEDQDSALNYVDKESLVASDVVTSIAERDVVKEDLVDVETEESMQYEQGRETAQGEVPLAVKVAEASDVDNETPNGHVDEDQEIVFRNEEAACVNLIEVAQFLEEEKEGHSEIIPEDMEDMIDIADNEVSLDVQQLCENEVSQTNLSNKPPKESMNKETARRVEARVTKDDELISNEEKDTEYEIRHLQVIDEHPVERQDSTLTRFIDEEETSQKDEQQVTTEDDSINKEEKHTEGEVQRVQVIDDRPLKREDDAPTQLINKEEKVEEPMVTKDSLVKEDDQTHVQSIKDEEAKDVTVRSQVTSEGTEKYTQEEPTQEEKTGNEKIEEKREENKTIISKEQKDSSHNGIEKEDKDSKSASTLVMDLAKGKTQALASKPWNLKLQTWSVLVSAWCLFHWYSELPFPELSLVCSLMFILILLGYRKRTTNLVKYE